MAWVLRRIQRTVDRRCCALLLVSVLAGALGIDPAPASTAARWQWSIPKVMQMLSRTKIRVGARTIRIHTDTTLCSGVGRGTRRRGVRVWSDFDCTYSAFLTDGIYDCAFHVHIVGRRKFAVTHTRWVGGTP